MPVTPEPRRVDATTPGGNCGNPGGGAGTSPPKTPSTGERKRRRRRRRSAKRRSLRLRNRDHHRGFLNRVRSLRSLRSRRRRSFHSRRRSAAGEPRLSRRAPRGAEARARLVHPSGVCVGCRVSQASTSLRFVQFVKRFAFFRRAFVRGSRRSRRSRQNVSMASRSYVLPDPATNTGSRNMSLGDGAGQILRFLRVPAGVGQQGRLADVLGRASDEPRVRVRSWRASSSSSSVDGPNRTSPSSDMMRVVGFRVSRNSVALVKMPVATVCDLVSLDALSAAVPSRAESPRRVSAVSCPSVGAMCRAVWGRPPAPRLAGSSRQGT